MTSVTNITVNSTKGTLKAQRAFIELCTYRIFERVLKPVALISI